MATRYDDLDNSGQIAVEKGLEAALEQCGLDHHYLDHLIDALDEAVDIHNEDEED